MGALGRIDPWAAIWVPYVFFCAFCYWMFHTLTKPGGQPIGALERVFSKASAGIVRLIVRRSEEHTSEFQSLMRNSYAVFCLKKKQAHLPIILNHIYHSYCNTITYAYINITI